MAFEVHVPGFPPRTLAVGSADSFQLSVPLGIASTGDSLLAQEHGFPRAAHI